MEYVFEGSLFQIDHERQNPLPSVAFILPLEAVRPLVGMLLYIIVWNLQ